MLRQFLEFIVGDHGCLASKYLQAGVFGSSGVPYRPLCFLYSAQLAGRRRVLKALPDIVADDCVIAKMLAAAAGPCCVGASPRPEHHAFRRAPDEAIELLVCRGKGQQLVFSLEKDPTAQNAAGDCERHQVTGSNFAVLGSSQGRLLLSIRLRCSADVGRCRLRLRHCRRKQRTQTHAAFFLAAKHHVWIDIDSDSGINPTGRIFPESIYE